VPIKYRYLQNIAFEGPPYPSIEYPLPMDFDYTVTASARINQHISQISGTLAMSRLHPRFAQMTCPAGTVRRITILGTTRTNSMETDKRLFRQIYQVRVSTEVEDIVTLLPTRVRQLVLTIMEKNTGELLWGPGTSSAIQPGDYLSPAIPGQYQSEE